MQTFTTKIQISIDNGHFEYNFVASNSYRFLNSYTHTSMSDPVDPTTAQATENVAEGGDEGKLKTLTNILKKCEYCAI